MESQPGHRPGVGCAAWLNRSSLWDNPKGSNACRWAGGESLGAGLVHPPTRPSPMAWRATDRIGIVEFSTRDARSGRSNARFRHVFICPFGESKRVEGKTRTLLASCASGYDLGKSAILSATAKFKRNRCSWSFNVSAVAVGSMD